MSQSNYIDRNYKKRKSVKEFDPNFKIPRKLKKQTELAIEAPSSINLQP